MIKEITQEEILNLKTEFKNFQKIHCEIGEDKFVSFNELCTAFWSYTDTLKYVPLRNIHIIMKNMIKSFSPEIQFSGFLMQFADISIGSDYCKSDYAFAYVVGMGLKSFPLIKGGSNMDK
jgi:hypothetical protein